MESTNNEILDQVRQLNHKFSQLESEKSIVKQANSLLSKRLVHMERQCWANAQYSRRECLELVGIPDSGQNNELGDKVLPFSKRLVVKYLHMTLSHAIVVVNDRMTE